MWGLGGGLGDMFIDKNIWPPICIENITLCDYIFQKIIEILYRNIVVCEILRLIMKLNISFLKLFVMRKIIFLNFSIDF